MDVLKIIRVFCGRGETNLPTESEINKFVEQGYTPCIYLDANICLNAANYYNNKTLTKEIKDDLLVLIEYFQKGNISLFPDYGVLELVCKKDGFRFDKAKYDEIIDKINYIFWLPINRHNKNIEKNLFNVTDKRDYTAYHELLDKRMIFFLLTYAALLKLHLIAKKSNPSKSNFLKNLQEYLTWCHDELNTSLALEIYLALKIFGGHSKFRKMIALDNKANWDELFDVLFSTTWDIFHIKLMFLELMEVQRKSIFITEDNNLGTLLQSINLEAEYRLNNGKSIFSLADDSESTYKKYVSQDAVDKIINNFTNAIQQSYDPKAALMGFDKLLPIILDLEEKINNA